MDPESSAEFTTDCINAEPKSPLCEVLPVPTEVERLLGGLGRHCPSNRSKFQVQAQNKTGCWGQLHGWGPWELHLCKVKHDSALCRVQMPSLHTQQDRLGRMKVGEENQVPKNDSRCLQISISLSVSHKTLVFPARCSTKENKCWRRLGKQQLDFPPRVSQCP